MKKTYKKVELEIIFLPEEDVIKTSQNDTVVDMPEFPEDFE